MRYLLTLVGPRGGGEDEDPTPDQLRAAMEPWNAYNREALEAGVFVAGDGLAPSSIATTTVRLAETGDQTVTDGPFAETKEQLGGFYVLDCADLDEALRWAKKVPIRPGGGVEVRPVADFSEFGYVDPYELAAEAS